MDRWWSGPLGRDAAEAGPGEAGHAVGEGIGVGALPEAELEPVPARRFGDADDPEHVRLFFSAPAEAPTTRAAWLAAVLNQPQALGQVPAAWLDDAMVDAALQAHPAALAQVPAALQTPVRLEALLVRVLQRLGLVRIAAGSDQREASVELTEQGRALLQRAVPLWREVQCRIEAKLDATQAAELRNLLQML